LEIVADRLLLVDDDPLLIEAVQFSLERAGYEVHSASRNAEASIITEAVACTRSPAGTFPPSAG
jgi:DNA-binding response OmpR family regulator